MTETFIPVNLGHYLTPIPPSQEYLTLHFSPTAAPRNRRWRNYGLSADFLGDYFAAFFPGDEQPSGKINRRDTVKAAVSYIANELLENAVKYSDSIVDIPISITLHLYEQKIIFRVVNHATADVVHQYQTYVQQILNANMEEFYMQQMEETALGLGESHMGLLTMINDYGAEFGWRFSPGSCANTITVDVMVQLQV